VGLLRAAILAGVDVALAARLAVLDPHPADDVPTLTHGRPPQAGMCHGIGHNRLAFGAFVILNPQFGVSAQPRPAETRRAPALAAILVAFADVNYETHGLKLNEAVAPAESSQESGSPHRLLLQAISK